MVLMFNLEHLCEFEPNIQVLITYTTIKSLQFFLLNLQFNMFSELSMNVGNYYIT